MPFFCGNRDEIYLWIEVEWYCQSTYRYDIVNCWNHHGSPVHFMNFENYNFLGTEAAGAGK